MLIKPIKNNLLTSKGLFPANLNIIIYKMCITDFISSLEISDIENEID